MWAGEVGGESKELSLGSRNDVIQLWGESQVQTHWPGCSQFLYLIDFLEQTISLN